MSSENSNRSIVSRLLLVTVLMFGFGFALVPLYDVFCRVTGLNGKVSGASTPGSAMVQQNREVMLRFVTSNNESMPWSFRAQEQKVVLKPGQTFQTAFEVHNPTGRKMVAQAIPSVSPGLAAQYLHKINCFCFEQQTLQAGETMDMPLVVSIDTSLPDDIHALTLSYTLFDITDRFDDGRELFSMADIDTTPLTTGKQGDD